MSTSLTWEGLSALRQQLQQLPNSLADEAANVVQATAERTGQELSSNYPIGPTGNLKRYVKVIVHRDKLNTTAVVVSAAPHSHLFENGTVQRTTRQGWNRGRMPQGPESQRLIPRAIRARQRMTAQLVQVLKDAGLEVHES